MSNGFVAPEGGGVLVRFRVSPGAKSTGLRGTYGEEASKSRVAAPPPEVRVARGLSVRDKIVLLGGVSAARARRATTSRLA